MNVKHYYLFFCLLFAISGKSQTFNCSTSESLGGGLEFPGCPCPDPANPPIVTNSCDTEPLFYYGFGLDLGDPQMTNSDPISLEFRIFYNNSSFTPQLNNVTITGTTGTQTLTTSIQSNNVVILTFNNIVMPSPQTNIRIRLPFLATQRITSSPLTFTSNVLFFENGTFVDCKEVHGDDFGIAPFKIFNEIQGPLSNFSPAGNIGTSRDTPSEVIGDLFIDLPEVDLGPCSAFETNGPSPAGMRSELHLQDNTSIIVEAGNTLNVCDLELIACGVAPFRGIEVQSGATLNMRSCHIDGAQSAIILHDGANLILENTNFDNCNIGVRTTGQANITTFAGNTFNGGIGVNLLNSNNTNLDAGSAAEANTFIGCSEGIIMQASSADIAFNNFENCNYGIKARGGTGRSQVNNNNIGYLNTGIHCDGASMNIGSGSAGTPPGPSNYIGYNTVGRGHTAVYAISSVVDVANNMIGANSYGVKMELNFSNTDLDINDNVIEVKGDSGENFGVYTFWNSGIRVNNNWIYGDDQKAAIVSTHSPDIVTNNGVFSDCENGIAMLGNVQDAHIVENLIESNPDNGIFVQNAMANEVHDNEINANSVGLWVRRNSPEQYITCNRFENGNSDIRSQSTLGIQGNANNEFRELGSFAEQDANLNIDFSRFFIDEDAVNLNILKPEDFTPGNGDCTENNALFKCEKSNGNNAVCSGWAGPHGLNPTDPEFPCWLADSVRDLKQSDPQAYWIQYRQLLKRYVNTDGSTDYPCVLCYCGPNPDPEDCGLESLVALEQDLESTYSIITDDATTSINLITDLKNKALFQLNSLGEENSETLCNNETYRLYRDIYILKLKQLTGIVPSSAELSRMRSASDLCPDTYGEVVHWARGLRANYEDVSYSHIDCTSWEDLDQRERVTTESITLEVLTLSPNPASHEINLMNNNPQGISYNIKSIDGRVVKTGRVNEHESTTINLNNWESGLYLLEQYDTKDRLLEVTKFTKQ